MLTLMFPVISSMILKKNGKKLKKKNYENSVLPNNAGRKKKDCSESWRNSNSLQNKRGKKRGKDYGILTFLHLP